MNPDIRLTLCLCALGLLALGCRPRPPVEWVGPNVLDIPPLSEEDAAPAEILYRGMTFVLHSQNDWYVQEQVHEVRRINEARGMDWANVYFWVSEGDRLVDFRARSLAVDGTVRELSADDVHYEDYNKDSGAQLATFRFPGVEPGSIVEFVYTLEATRRYKSWEQHTVNESIPVRRHRTVFRGTSDVIRRFEAFNAPEDAVAQGSSGIGWQVEFAVDDVMPWRDESFGPDRERGRIWWLYKTKRIGRMKVHRSWAAELKGKSRDFYKDPEWLAGFDDPWAAPDGCAPLDCAAAVLARSHEDTELETHTIWRDIRPLGDVLAARRTNTAEKAALIHTRLAAAGVESRFAYHTSRVGGLFDIDTPDLDYFDNILIYVPEQKGISEEIWIDPTCEWCGLGELPQGLDRNRAVIFRRNEDDQVAALPRTPKARWRPEPTWARRSRVELDVDGHATVTETITRTESMAQRTDDFTRDDKPEERLKRLDAELVRDFPGRANLEVDVECDRLEGRCVETRRFTLPDYAVVDGDAMYVPLTLLDNPVEGSFYATDRDYPVIFDKRNYEHTLEIVPPEGVALVGTPVGAQVSAGRGAISASLQIIEPAEDEPLRVTWRMTLDEAEHAPEDYAEVRDAMRMLVPLRSKALTWVEPPPPEPTPEAPPPAEALTGEATE